MVARAGLLHSGPLEVPTDGGRSTATAAALARGRRRPGWNMRDNYIERSNRGMTGERRHGRDGEPPLQLPLVIRPVPLRLSDVERRARRDPEFAATLQRRPEVCALLARALLQRDAAARALFADHRSLCDHLRSLRAG